MLASVCRLARSIRARVFVVSVALQSMKSHQTPMWIKAMSQARRA